MTESAWFADLKTPEACERYISGRPKEDLMRVQATVLRRLLNSGRPRDSISAEEVLEAARAELKEYNRVRPEILAEVDTTHGEATPEVKLEPSTDATPIQIADFIARQFRAVRIQGLDKLYVWDLSGIYVPGEDRIKDEARKYLRDKETTHLVNEIVAHVHDKYYAPIENFDADPNVLNVKNGLINVQTGEFKPHDPAYLSLVQLPIEYHPDATCQKIDAFFLQINEPRYKQTLYEVVAWCLQVRSYAPQSAVGFLGKGGNGKSTFLAMLERFLGKKNCSNVPIQELVEDRFAAAHLVGKFANITADLPKKKLAATERFKQATGGDRISTQTKYGDRFEFNNTAKIIFSTNELPPSPDDSPAYHRRMVIIPFNNVFAGDAMRDQDELLADLATELSGLLNAAITAQKALKARKRFDCDTQTWDEKQDFYNKATKPIYAFIEEHIVIDATFEQGELKDAVYKAYQAYCKKLRTTVDNEERFWRQFKGEVERRAATFKSFQPHGGQRRLRFVRLVERKDEDIETSETGTALPVSLGEQKGIEEEWERG